MEFKWNCEEEEDTSTSKSGLAFQIIGQNLQIKQGETCFQPCEKKTGFTMQDGPVFKAKIRKSSSKKIGECYFHGLQTLDKAAHIRLVLRHGPSVVVCPGVMRFPIPITCNYPGFNFWYCDGGTGNDEDETGFQHS